MATRFLSIALLTICAVTIFGTALIPQVAHAQEYEYQEDWVIIPPECRGADDSKTCDLNSFVQLFVNLAIVGMKVLPYLAMIMMIWAGFNFIQSGGNPEKIQGGKKMLSSIVIGVLIVTILAWTWSYFMVFLLTGNEKLFTGYEIWERDWWGGGSIQERAPEIGCCVVTDAIPGVLGVGCVENLQTQCANIETNAAASGISILASFQGEGTSCGGNTQCQNYQQGCCVPRDETNKTCYIPVTGAAGSGAGGTGCLNWPETLNYTNDCAVLTATDGTHRCETIGNQTP